MCTVCMCRPEVDARYLPQLLFPLYIEGRSLVALFESSQIWIDYLVILLQGISVSACRGLGLQEPSAIQPGMYITSET